MFKTLLKKQFSELFSFIFVDKRKGVKRGKGGVILSIGLYLLLFAFMIGAFYMVSIQLCEPLVSVGLSWFYFAMFGFAAFMFGVLGSAFSTYSSMYIAKDNEMLFAMPIKPRLILASRLVSVYLLSLVYVLLLFIPAAAAYLSAAKVDPLGIVLLVLMPFVLALLASAFSCLLGWLISLVAGKIKNKTFVTVIGAILFIGLYYLFYFRMSSIIKKILDAPFQIAESVKSYAYPLYLMGMGSSGDAVKFILFALICIAVAALVYLIISLGFAKSVIGSASSSGKKSKARYSQKDIRASSVSNALFKKEFLRFTSSPNYMLNANIGIVFIIAAAVALFIKGGALRSLIVSELSFDSGIFSLLACGGLFALSSMNFTTASSVSLEGKHLWLVHSLPVEPKTALLAKLKLHLALVLPPLALLYAAFVYAFRLPLLHSIVIAVASVLFVLLVALIGLVLNLKWANVHWTNEVIPVKQSMPVFICMLGGMALMALPVAAYFFFSSRMSVDPLAYISIVAVILAVLCLILYRLTVTWGAKKFAELD